MVGSGVLPRTARRQRRWPSSARFCAQNVPTVPYGGRLPKPEGTSTRSRRLVTSGPPQGVPHGAGSGTDPGARTWVIVVSNRRPIAAVDATWLRMDRPDNLMVIESVVWFETPVDWDRLAGVVRRRMVARYPVFRQRPVFSRTPLVPSHWED